VSTDYVLDVGAAAVAQFNVVLVEYFIQLVVERELRFEDFEELLSDVGGVALTIRWIEPYDIASAGSFARLVGSMV